jgi:hypothetical protein
LILDFSSGFLDYLRLLLFKKYIYIYKEKKNQGDQIKRIILKGVKISRKGLEKIFLARALPTPRLRHYIYMKKKKLRGAKLKELF